MKGEEMEKIKRESTIMILNTLYLVDNVRNKHDFSLCALPVGNQ